MAVNKVDGDTKIFVSRYIGLTNTKGSRFKYQWVNVSFEGIEPAKMVSWNYEGSNQTDQLQLALGKDWKVLTQWELHVAVAKWAANLL